MTHCLVFDCSDQQLSVCLTINDQQVSKIFQQPRQHAQQLLPTIQSLHQQLDAAINQLSTVGVTIGPGSFTGLRIAVSCAQALSYSTGCNIVPLSSLHALALSAHNLLQHEPSSNYILTMMDARMNELYWGLYQQQNNKITSIIEDQISHVDEWQLPSVIAQQSNLMAVGAGTTLVNLPKYTFIYKDSQVDSVSLVNEILRLEAEGQTVVAEQLEPIYLRSSNVWKKTNQQKTKVQTKN